MPKISVIIPTFGIPLYLEKSIQSVFNQTFNDWELIVVDDNNPNTEARIKTEQLMQKWLQSGRVQYLKHERNKNGSAARNTGIRAATGIYIAFLDSDDEYLPQRLEVCCNALETADHKYAGVYTGCEFRQHGKKKRIFTEAQTGQFLIETLACTFAFYTGSNIFVRRKIIDDLIGFDESFLRHQDYEFLVRLFKNYELIGISKVLVIKNDENFNLPNVEKMISIKEQYRNKYIDIINSLDEASIRYIYHSHYVQIAEAAIKSDKFNLAKEYYTRAVEYGSLTIKERLRRIALSALTIIR